MQKGLNVSGLQVSMLSKDNNFPLNMPSNSRIHSFPLNSLSILARMA